VKYLLVSLLIILSQLCLAETVQIEKSFALKMLVASYVNGFKEYDTTVVGGEGVVSIGIYVDRAGQTKEGAEALSARFKEQVPRLLKLQSWAKDTEVVVNIY
jgi:hypothetical protein